MIPITSDGWIRACLHSSCPEDGGDGVDDGGEPVMAVWSLLRETASRWSGHKASLLGAAIAYYSVFSHGPLMVIAIAIAGFVFGDDAARGEVSLELKNLLGETGAQAVQAMLAGASRRHNGLVAGMIGVGTLLLAAIWVVVALKEALNTIWDVVAPPSGGVWSLAKSYRFFGRRAGVVISAFGILAGDNRARGRRGIYHAVPVGSDAASR
jgi:uncharacterized BrkB/YihY/UPF0761 family membrane protein